MKKVLVVLSLLLCMCSVSFAKFSDVKIYKDEIDYLVSKKIINGYEDGSFRPEGKITRAELVKMVVTALNAKTSKESKFSDVNNNHWAKSYIDVAVANDLIKGDPEGTFRPENNVTYGEVATILVRAMGKEELAEKLYLSWPDNYMKEAKFLDLFYNYKTNDLVSTNEARRDSVALMIYNMINADTEKTNSTKESEKIKIDSKANAYAGVVVSQLQRRGIQNVKVEDNDGNEYTFPVYKKSSIPALGSFIIYQLTDDDELKLCTEIKKTSINNGFYNVESVEDEIVKLNGVSKPFDLDAEKYTIGGKTFKLEKIYFFIIEYDEDEFTDYRIEDYETVKFKKNDKVKFDDTYNICYIVREQ